MKKTKIDCLGDMCPVPILKLQEEMKSMKSGDEIMLVSDHSCVVQNIHDFLDNKKKLDFQILEVMNGIWEITVIKE